MAWALSLAFGLAVAPVLKINDAYINYFTDQHGSWKRTPWNYSQIKVHLLGKNPSPYYAGGFGGLNHLKSNRAICPKTSNKHRHASVGIGMSKICKTCATSSNLRSTKTTLTTHQMVQLIVRHVCIITYIYIITIIEGSLNSKLPTIRRVEKQIDEVKPEESKVRRWSRVRRKKMQ